MKIEAFIIMYNEAEILPLVIKHYKKFCDRLTFFDNYSSDNSQQIAESMGCDVKKFGQPGVLDDQAYLDVKNHCWKNSDADWVIVCDADEILNPVPSDSKVYPTIFKTRGWNIYSNDMPKDSLLDITTGYEFHNYSKSIMFSPKDIKEMNYEPGAHKCNPIGNIVYSEETFDLLHYKNIGGVERLLKRNQEYRNRMSYQNKKMGWGIHYYDSEAKVRQEWIERLAKSKPLL